MRKTINLAINGFGRIGRAAFKIAMKNPLINVVAVNDLTDNAALANLLKFDSVYGQFDGDVRADEKFLYINDKKIPVYAEADPSKLPWKKLAVDVVLECTGHFVRDGSAKAHLSAGAKRVIISAPTKGKPEVPTYLLGVNADKYQGEPIISMGSCTTNSIGAVTKIINENFGVKEAFLTTVHSYTADQNLVDGPHQDLRRARSAAVNIVPTSTGATIAITKIMPKLVGKFDGLSLRVPTPCGSISDLTYLVRQKTTVAKVNSALKKASHGKELKNILAVSEAPLVSSDIIGSTFSGIVDLPLTKVLGDNFIKIMVWYDNEWAYAARLVDMITLM